MKKGKSKRPALTKAALKRALHPPHDDTQEILHGKLVKDPFRPLENLDAPATKAWVARHNQRFDDYMRDVEPVEAEVMAFFKNAQPRGLRETMPKKYGNTYIVQRKEEDAKRYAYYVKDVPDYDAPARLLLDPVQIDPSGKTAIKFASFTGDGKTVAYALSVSGADKATLKFMEVDTGKEIDLSGFVANFAQEVMQGRWPQSVEGMRRPACRMVRPP